MKNESCGFELLVFKNGVQSIMVPKQQPRLTMSVTVLEAQKSPESPACAASGIGPRAHQYPLFSTSETFEYLQSPSSWIKYTHHGRRFSQVPRQRTDR
jgi:hypothetical protein